MKELTDPAPSFNRREFLKLTGSFLFFSVVLSSTRFLPKKENLTRPPGAVKEETFTSICHRCGKCVEACPENIIKPAGPDKGFLNTGTPHIDYADRKYCTRCMKCTKVCPTNALMKIEEAEADLGTANIDYEICLRCLACYPPCPVKAIQVEEGNKPVVISEKCVGCNICTSFCPPDPPAITMRPEGAHRPEWSPP